MADMNANHNNDDTNIMVKTDVPEELEQQIKTIMARHNLQSAYVHLHPNLPYELLDAFNRAGICGWGYLPDDE